MKPQFCTIIFILLSCNIIFLLIPQPRTSPDTRKLFDPITFIISRITVILAAYISTTLLISHHPSFHKLISTIHRTWHRPAITLLYIELYAAAPATVAVTLATVARSVHDPLQEVILLSLFIGLLPYLWPTMFPYSEIMLKMGVIVSVVEGCEGPEALRRTGRLVEGMALEGLALTTGLTVAQQVPLVVLGGGEWCARSLVLAGPAHLAMKVVVYLGYTLFYFDCKKRKKGTGLEKGARSTAAINFNRSPSMLLYGL